MRRTIRNLAVTAGILLVVSSKPSYSRTLSTWEPPAGSNVVAEKIEPQLESSRQSYILGGFIGAMSVLGVGLGYNILRKRSN